MKKYRLAFIGILAILILCMAVMFLDALQIFSHSSLCDVAVIISGIIIGLSIVSGLIYFIYDFIRKKVFSKTFDEKDSTKTFKTDYIYKYTDHKHIENIKKDMGPGK